ncbi:hypothetical protein [Winogradskyella sp.]|uniref:hypothetical protein n=1 Tax=Winogradskyella sp. TaxID=1883156 RepID=UPI003AB1CEFD
MKSYLFILFLLLFCCNSDDAENQSIKEFEILNSSTTFKENFKIRNENLNRIIIKSDKDSNLDELIISTNNSLINYTSSNATLLHNKGVYVIINDEEITVINTSKQKDGVHLYKIVQHYLGLNQRLNSEVLGMYMSNSCTVSAADYEGVIKTKTFKFDQILDPNIYQLVVDTEDYVYVYKLNVEDAPVIYEELEPIFSFQKKSWYSFSDAPVEKIFLDEKRTFIESRESEFIDHSQDLTETNFEWESNNKKQVFDLTEISLIKNILDEI